MSLTTADNLPFSAQTIRSLEKKLAKAENSFKTANTVKKSAKNTANKATQTAGGVTREATRFRV